MSQPLRPVVRGIDRARLAGLVVADSVRSFGANRLLDGAATLALFGFLALMPLLLLALLALGWFVNSSDAVTRGMASVMETLFPTYHAELLADLQRVAGQRGWGAVGVLALVWATLPFAGAMRGAMRRIFRADARVGFLAGKLGDLGAVLLLLLLFVALVAARLWVGGALGLIPGGVGRALHGLLSPLLTFVVMALVYRAFAPVRLAPREIIAGAATATVLLMAMRPIFALMLLHNPAYGYAFGSLKAIFLLIVWVYYTFAVVLFGAEVAANTRRREALVLSRLLLPGRNGPPRSLPNLLARFARVYGDGDLVFREGDISRDLYVVSRGAVLLSREGRELRRMLPGDYFGEMSMLLGAPRSATAIAAEADTELIVVSAANQDVLFRENPALVRRMLEEMARRLQSMNERILA